MKEYCQPHDRIDATIARFPILKTFSGIGERFVPGFRRQSEPMITFDAELVNEYLGYRFCERWWPLNAESVNKILNEIEKKDGALEIVQ